MSAFAPLRIERGWEAIGLVEDDEGRKVDVGLVFIRDPDGRLLEISADGNSLLMDRRLAIKLAHGILAAAGPDEELPCDTRFNHVAFPYIRYAAEGYPLNLTDTPGSDTAGGPTWRAHEKAA